MAGELRRRGAEFVLAGRNPAKLEILAEDLGGDVQTNVAELDDPAALRTLLEPCAAVIACAGPFVEYGEPVVAAAVEARAHYLDTTGEQRFIRKVLDEYGPRADRAGIAALPAMGFDYAPGDLLASLTAAGMGDLDELVVAYAARGFGPTRGTALSALDILAGESWEWRDGELASAEGGVGAGSWDFPEPIGRERMVRYPAGEHLTVPRHVRTDRVRTMLTASTVMPIPLPGVKWAAPLMMAPVQLAVRTPFRRALEAAIPRLPDGPSEEARRRSTVMVVCEATRGADQRHGVLRGSDVYGLTARTTVEGALRVTAPDYDRAGGLAPSEAFDPADFLDSLSGFGVEYEVGVV